MGILVHVRHLQSMEAVPKDLCLLRHYSLARRLRVGLPEISQKLQQFQSMMMKTRTMFLGRQMEIIQMGISDQAQSLMSLFSLSQLP